MFLSYLILPDDSLIWLYYNKIYCNYDFRERRTTRVFVFLPPNFHSDLGCLKIKLEPNAQLRVSSNVCKLKIRLKKMFVNLKTNFVQIFAM